MYDFTLLHEIEQDFEPGMAQKELFYRINYWLPLNPENYVRWKNSAGMHGRVTILNKCLIGHVKSFLRRMEFEDHSKEIQVKIHDIERKHNRINLHSRPVICYSVIFRSNVCLPDFIGLGQGPSFGFGRIKRIKNDI
ncbi:MAG: CRISPR-associated endonuclease Cas6 [Desulfobacula sp.]|nr:CRISPR-associated endonuclease Cas6 [Desulfobacula sp.]